MVNGKLTEHVLFFSQVNLGVVSSNPGSKTGLIKIMKFLHEYVPTVDEAPMPILCCADTPSVERMIHCRRDRNGGQTPAQRLEGLIPTPQEFHKEMFLLQVIQQMEKRFHCKVNI